MLGHSSLVVPGSSDAAKRVPDGYSSNPRRHFRKHEHASRIDRAAPFLTTKLAQFYKRKPIAREALETTAGPARSRSRWRAACDRGKTGGADDIGGHLPLLTSRWPACGSGCPRKRRTRAYGGALRAYDKNRRHPIPAIFALGQYGAVNVAESGYVRK